ncbi:bifunctional NUDIX hydrolase/phosphatase PAP2 family protein [Photobacterium sp. MCCC 1A19761]|uniref:bifunctional NUDIX hydrolase/phosphatase PAP2 family protein n=1 Tax=Photobacterium sp. MCCC 1A19761 TaxID=3115000 RepID=UPI00307FA2FF
MQHALLLFSLFAGLFSSFAFAQTNIQAQPETRPKGATCVIRDDRGQVILVQDNLTRTLSLPGGYIDSHETFRAAARRETLEETGIKVDVGKQLSINQNRVVFACRPSSRIGYIEPAVDHGFNAQIIPALDSEHFGKEIRQVYLTALTPVVMAKYRYPSDAEALHSWVNASEPTNFYPLQDLTDRADSLHFLLLSFIESFQSWVKSIAPARELLNLSNWLGEGAIAIGLLILCFLIFPLRYGLTIAFALLATAYSVNLLKIGLAIPRPFYFLPSLQQAQASGFSFPSGHATQAAAMIGVLIGWLLREGKQRVCISVPTAVVGWFGLSLLAGAARVWLGVHYPTDVAAGIGLGGIIALVSLAVCHYRYANDKPLIESKRLWLLLLGIYLYGTSQLIQPLYVFSWFAALGIFMSLCFIPLQPADSRKHLVKHNKVASWQQVVLALSGVGVIVAVPMILISPATTSIFILAANSVAICCGVLWLLVGAPRLSQKLVTATSGNKS